ncbi:MAG: hypothetical protein E5V58_00375 [Mesorhizobium sp.]|nr:MAG: hypothetical protein E5V58_00375 [Mesorhizobium sp.]TJV99122.1 MAG: hypothetical protein E5W97_31000 [Mesorhizobium sp.]
MVGFTSESATRGLFGAKSESGRKLNAVLATQPGSTGRSVANRDQYPAQQQARLSFADLERCVALHLNVRLRPPRSTAAPNHEIQWP